MKPTAIAIALVLQGQLAGYQQLPGVIDQNIKSASGRLEEVGAKTPQLWIHVRTDAQRKEVESKIAWFKGLQVSGAKLDVRPIQQVATGPQRSELRFFRAGDRAQAQTLLAQVAKAVPAAVLNDLSAQYRQAKWIEPGHFELWLAPTVTRLAQ